MSKAEQGWQTLLKTMVCWFPDAVLSWEPRLGVLQAVLSWVPDAAITLLSSSAGSKAGKITPAGSKPAKSIPGKHADELTPFPVTEGPIADDKRAAGGPG